MYLTCKTIVKTIVQANENYKFADTLIITYNGS